MIPYNPFRLASGKQLDPEGVNDNLEKMTADLNRSMDLRYSYSDHVFELDDLDSTDTTAQRTYRLKRHIATARYEVVGVELVVFAATGTPDITWTLSCNDADWPSIAVTTAGSSVEARAVSPSRAQVPSGDGLEFVLTASAASTIAWGYIVLHMRADRGSQGDTFTRYSPTLLNAASSTAGTTLDTELNAYEDSVEFNTNADKDYRFETYTVRGLGGGNSIDFRIPGGAYRWGGVHLVNVSAVGRDLELRIGGSLVATASGAGTSVITSTVADFTGLITPGTDPMDPADDTTITLTANGGTIARGYVTIIWS